jgi:lysophospholipase L1-like esterase
MDDAEGLSEYRDVLRNLWEEIERTTAARILFVVTIPPDREKFLESSNNFYYTSKVTRQRMADRATLYLQEALSIAEDEEWPTADVYSDVLKKVAGGDKLRRYINQSDCLNPSIYGYQAIARVIVRAIDKHEIIQEVIPK